MAREIAGRTPVEDAPTWFPAVKVAVLYDAAATVVLASWSALGFETPVTVITSAPDGIVALKPSVNTFDASVALSQPVWELEHVRGDPAKPPTSVMIRRPPDGMGTCGVRVITMVTPTAFLKGPGVLSAMDG